MLLEKEKIVSSGKTNQRLHKKRISFALLLLGLSLFSVAYFLFSMQTENKTERLAALKEKCYLQIALTEDEKTELCDLLFELENVPKENCENIENILFQQNLDTV